MTKKAGSSPPQMGTAVAAHPVGAPSPTNYQQAASPFGSQAGQWASHAGIPASGMSSPGGGGASPYTMKSPMNVPNMGTQPVNPTALASQMRGTPPPSAVR